MGRNRWCNCWMEGGRASAPGSTPPNLATGFPMSPLYDLPFQSYGPNHRPHRKWMGAEWVKIWLSWGKKFPKDLVRSTFHAIWSSVGTTPGGTQTSQPLANTFPIYEMDSSSFTQPNPTCVGVGLTPDRKVVATRNRALPRVTAFLLPAVPYMRCAVVQFHSQILSVSGWD